MKIRVLLLSIWLVFLSVFSIYAQEDGGIPGEFLRWGIGSRAIGMGRAYTAVVNDATSCYWNPAGLADDVSIHLSDSITKKNFWQRVRASISYLNLLGGTNFQFISLAYGFGKRSSFGLSYLCLSSGPVQGWQMQNDFPVETNTFESRKSAYFLSWAGRISYLSTLDVGITFKYINKYFSGYDHEDCIGFDCGIRWRPSFSPFNFGATLQNFNVLFFPMKFGSDQIPISTRGGISYSAFTKKNFKMLLALDYEFINKRKPSFSHFRFGSELKFLNPVSFLIRFGINQNEISGGIGFQLNGISQFSNIYKTGVVGIDIATGRHHENELDNELKYSGYLNGSIRDPQHWYESAIKKDNWGSDKAKWLLLRILDEYPDSKFAAKSYARLADFEFENRKFGKALKYFKKAFKIAYGTKIDIFNKESEEIFRRITEAETIYNRTTESYNATQKRFEEIQDSLSTERNYLSKKSLSAETSKIEKGENKVDTLNQIQKLELELDSLNIELVMYNTKKATLEKIIKEYKEKYEGVLRYKNDEISCDLKYLLCLLDNLVNLKKHKDSELNEVKSILESLLKFIENHDSPSQFIDNKYKVCYNLIKFYHNKALNILNENKQNEIQLNFKNLNDNKDSFVYKAICDYLCGRKYLKNSNDAINAKIALEKFNMAMNNCKKRAENQQFYNIIFSILNPCDESILDDIQFMIAECYKKTADSDSEIKSAIREYAKVILLYPDLGKRDSARIQMNKIISKNPSLFESTDTTNCKIITDFKTETIVSNLKIPYRIRKHDNKLYVSCWDEKLIKIYTTDGKNIENIPHKKDRMTIFAGSVIQNDSIYVACPRNHEIKVYETKHKNMPLLIGSDNGKLDLECPVDVACDDSTLFILNFEGYFVREYSISLSQFRTCLINYSLKYPITMKIDAITSEVYVADWGNQRVIKLRKEPANNNWYADEFARYSQNGKFWSPIDIDIEYINDKKKFIYILYDYEPKDDDDHTGNKILKYSQDGNIENIIQNKHFLNSFIVESSENNSIIYASKQDSGKNGQIIKFYIPSK